MIRRSRSRWLLACVLPLALLATACGDDGSETAGAQAPAAASGEVTDAGTITFAGEQEPTSLNFLHAEDNMAWTMYVMSLVWPYLYHTDPTNQLIPNDELATVEVTSEDPLELTIAIDPDAVWSDGTPITAEDFVFTWEAQRDCSPESGWNCAGAAGYQDIESVVAGASDKEVVATFAVPFADWKALWSPLLPAHAFTAAGGGDPQAGFTTGFKLENLTGANAANLEKYVVSGSWYEVSAIEPGSSLTLTRNDAYWGEPATTETIVFSWIDDPTQQPLALANDEADAAFPSPQIDLLEQLQALDGFRTEVGFGTFWEQLTFNGANRHLADVEVRKAVAQAVDREAIVDTVLRPFDETAEVLNNRIFFPADERYADNSGELGEQDIEAARARLEEAGYTAGDDGIYVSPDGERLELRISWLDPDPRREQIAQLVQAQAKEAGIAIVLDPRADYAFLDEADFDIALFGWTGGTVLAYTQPTYVADGGQNFGMISNERIAELYEQANVEIDPERRAELMNEIDTELWEIMHSLPLAQNPEVLVSAESLGNFVYNGFTGPMWNAYTWGEL